MGINMRHNLYLDYSYSANPVYHGESGEGCESTFDTIRSCKKRREEIARKREMLRQVDSIEFKTSADVFAYSRQLIKILGGNK